MASIQGAIDSTGRVQEPSIQEIATAVARRFKLKTADLKGPTRRQQVVRARALAMFLGRKLTDRSLQQIGNFFGGRDHTTVLHACRKTEELMGSNPDLLLAADEVTETLRVSA
jgi:chromosomal replication initiator protein